MWLVWFGLLGWSGWYYVLELVRVADKVCLGWLWQSGISKWSDRTGKSKVHSVLDSLKAFFFFSFIEVTVCPELPKNILTSATPTGMGGFGVIFMPKKTRPQQLLIFLSFCESLWNFVTCFEICKTFVILWNFWNFVACFEILWNFWNFVPCFKNFVRFLKFGNFFVIFEILCPFFKFCEFFEILYPVLKFCELHIWNKLVSWGALEGPRLKVPSGIDYKVKRNCSQQKCPTLVA